MNNVLDGLIYFKKFVKDVGVSMPFAAGKYAWACESYL